MKGVEVGVISVVNFELRELLSGLYFSKIPFQTTEIYWRLEAVVCCHWLTDKHG